MEGARIIEAALRGEYSSSDWRLGGVIAHCGGDAVIKDTDVLPSSSWEHLILLLPLSLSVVTSRPHDMRRCCSMRPSRLRAKDAAARLFDLDVSFSGDVEFHAGFPLPKKSSLSSYS